MEFKNEHLWAGQVGHYFILLAFIAAVFSFFFYYITASRKDLLSPDYTKLGRLFFRIHSFAVFGMCGTLLFMLLNHYFEFHYVFQHSDMRMPMKYILASFWEGQEGSFMLWIFWHAVLGNIMLISIRNFEAPAMATMALVQAFLGTMILGFYFDSFRIGTNPFTILVREHPDYFGAPFTMSKDYLDKLPEMARGLNPLLQNYWMTIHPPTLFLGFAATTVPFCYAIAGIWQKRFLEWQKPAIPWAFFGILILGLGLLMGGAWAYESLSFGGFWAWDPVENASLVPWLILVAAGHLMLINRARGNSIFASALFSILAFLFVLYSTFLTRSGVLGDSSVHAFTNLGMQKQLALLVLFFLIWGVYHLLSKPRTKILYVSITAALIVASYLGLGTTSTSYLIGLCTVVFLFIAYKETFPEEKTEDHLWSREFWMFIGCLVLVISAMQITFYTSAPLHNKLLGLSPIKSMFTWLSETTGLEIFQNLSKANFTAKKPQEAIRFYNKWQVPFAIIICLLIAAGQFFKYKKTDLDKFTKNITLSFAIAVIISFAVMILMDIKEPFYIILLTTSLFAIFANLDYFIRILNGKVANAGASIAHVGFGMIMLGALISNGKKNVISANTSGVDLNMISQDLQNNDNIYLRKGDTLPMGPYHVVYKGRKQEGINIFFEVEYLKRDAAGTYKSEFTLHPFVQTNEKMGDVAEPDTKHFWHKDIFTHVRQTPMDLPKPGKDELGPAEEKKVWLGDTIFAGNTFLVLDTLIPVDPKTIGMPDSALGIKAKLRMVTLDTNDNITLEPIYVINGHTPESISAYNSKYKIRINISEIHPDERLIKMNLFTGKKQENDYIVLQAIEFPGINILWLGSVVMVIGSGISIWKRVRRSKKAS